MWHEILASLGVIVIGLAWSFAPMIEHRKHMRQRDRDYWLDADVEKEAERILANDP